MSRDRSFPLSKGVLKDAFVFLALSALLLVLARPVCDVLEWHGAEEQPGSSAIASYTAGEHHDGHYDPCCTSIEDGSLVALSASAAPPVERLPTPAAAMASPVQRAAVHSLVAWLPPDTPPISRPYHVRTARLLI